MLEEHINRATTAALMGNTPNSHKLEASFKVTTRLVKYLQLLHIFHYHINIRETVSSNTQ